MCCQGARAAGGKHLNNCPPPTPGKCSALTEIHARLGQSRNWVPPGITEQQAGLAGQGRVGQSRAGQGTWQKLCTSGLSIQEGIQGSPKDKGERRRKQGLEAKCTFVPLPGRWVPVGTPSPILDGRAKRCKWLWCVQPPTTESLFSRKT